MRVLFEGGDLHVAMPAGRFIVRRGGEIEWLTDYAPLKTHASSLDDDILVPGRKVPDGAHDALLLEGGRMAVLFDDRVEVLDRDDEVEMSVDLEGDGERLPLTTQEVWGKKTRFSGYKRGMRLFSAKNGFVVTANESGHVGVFSLEERGFTDIVRVPAAPENTVYATTIGDDLVIGMKWNGRHSDIFRLDPDGQIVGKWIEDDSGEVRWGMPGMALIGDAIVTYSDDGPNARQLALLSSDLEEIDNVPIPTWPTDIATDGERFAAVATNLLVIGHVEGSSIVIDQQWTVADLLKKANIAAPALRDSASDDGTGTRVWMKGHVTAVRPVSGTRAILSVDGRIVSLERDVQTPMLSAVVRRTLLDAHADRLAVVEGERYRVLAGPKWSEKLVAEPEGEGHHRDARLLEGGLVHLSSEKEDFDVVYTLTWCPPTGMPKELGTSIGSISDDFVLAHREGEVAWYELQREEGGPERWIVRWSPNVKRGQSVKVEQKVLALAFDGATLYAKAGDGREDDHIYRVTADGDLERVTERPLPFATRELAAGNGRVFFRTGTGMSADKVFPSQLFAVDVATGKQSIVSTATTGEISEVRVCGGHLWWLEARSGGMALMRVGQDDGMSAVCSLPL